MKVDCRSSKYHVYYHIIYRYLNIVWTQSPSENPVEVKLQQGVCMRIDFALIIWRVMDFYGGRHVEEITSQFVGDSPSVKPFEEYSFEKPGVNEVQKRYFVPHAQ